MSSDRFFNQKLMKKLDRKLQLIIDRVGVDRKTMDEVFDKSTLHALEKLISDKVLDILDFPISTGKEGNVFRGVTPDKTYVAVKIYRTSNSTFKHISEYIIGDPRFSSLPKNRRDVIFAWTQKEFKNLERLNRVGISAPKPIAKIKNVLVMEYIGDEEQPAPLLKDVKLDDPELIFNKLIDFISIMYKKAELVHSDMSAFNVLMHDSKPYLIDLGQGVLLEHPQAYEFLKRDIYNIVSYFKKFNIKADEKQIYMDITKKEW
jgi:RIO kinase 1